MQTLLAGTLLGLSFCAAPGPVTVETIRRGMRGGFRGALSVQLGSIVGDAAYAALALAGLAPLVNVPALRTLLWIAGGVALTILGVSGIRDGLKNSAPAGTAESPPSARSGFRSGVALSLANPTSIGWWLSIGGAMIASGVTGTGPEQTAIFLGGFLLAALIWAVAFSVGIRWGSARLAGRAQRAISVACGCAMLGLAAALIVRGMA